jgi:hypothetical protein
MFNKELLEEIGKKIKEINKMKIVHDRIDAAVNFGHDLRSRINDEIDEHFSNFNLKLTKEEKENK